jgi:drug/metabolite transporter (DMT)-like permease
MSSTINVSSAKPQTSTPATTRHPVRGYLYIAAAGLWWGISASLGKAVFSGRHLLLARPIRELDAQILSQTRVTLSLLILAPLVLLLRGPRALVIRQRDLAHCLVLGIVGIVSSNFFYYYAIEKGPIAPAIIVQYTAPVWVLLYMVARGRERPTPMRVGAVLAAVLGSMLAIGVVGEHLALVWISVGAALLAAFGFGFYNVYAHHLVAAHDRWKVLTYALLGASLFWLVVNNPWRIAAAHYVASQWLFMLVFACVSLLIPYGFYFAGLRYLDPTRAIVTSCLEPVFTVLIAATFLREGFGWIQALGMVIVLAASIAVQVPEAAGS